MPMLLALLFAAAPQSHPQTRCGWLSNPTPGNYSLTDRQGEWEMSAQGGYQAPGMDDLPDLTTNGWVATNGSYGYGCTCLSGSFDPRSHRVTRIVSARAVPLRQCRADPRLHRPR